MRTRDEIEGVICTEGFVEQAHDERREENQFV